MEFTEKDVQQMVTKCLRHLRKKKYEFTFKPEQVKAALNHLDVYKREGGRSWAGYRSIKINTKCWQFGNGKWTEYKRFAKDPVIGNIKVNDDEDILMCLVAHEVAHYVQYTYSLYMPKYLLNKTEKDRGHGECFQTIYRYLRADLVNPLIRKKVENN